MVKIILVIIGSYLVGSISPSIILGRILKGIDIREHGSGNAGSTNAFRVLGKWAGITVLLLDIFKGYFTVKFISPSAGENTISPLPSLLSYQVLLQLQDMYGQFFI